MRLYDLYLLNGEQNPEKMREIMTTYYKKRADNGSVVDTYKLFLLNSEYVEKQGYDEMIKYILNSNQELKMTSVILALVYSPIGRFYPDFFDGEKAIQFCEKIIEKEKFVRTSYDYKVLAVSYIIKAVTLCDGDIHRDEFVHLCNKALALRNYNTTEILGDFLKSFTQENSISSDAMAPMRKKIIKVLVRDGHHKNIKDFL